MRGKSKTCGSIELKASLNNKTTPQLKINPLNLAGNPPVPKINLHNQANPAPKIAVKHA